MRIRLPPSSSMLAAALLMLSFERTSAEVIPYHKHSIVPLHPEYLTIPKYSAVDAPHWSPGHGHSFIDLSRVTLHNECNLPSSSDCRNSTFQMLMFEETTEMYWMDYWPNRQFCCTSNMITEGDCDPEDLNTMINPLDLPGAFLRSIKVAPGQSLSFSHYGAVAHHDIVKSGIYVLLMGVCDPSSPPLKISGSIDSLDPYGYLPADLYSNLPFYGCLSLLYSVVGIVWLLLCFCHSENLMPLQFWISLVLALGMTETTVLFGQYLNWNDFGSPSIGVTILALIFGVLKRAVSRVVVLLVTLGYGVVRPSLGSQMGKVLGIGVAYFTLSLYYTITNSMPSRNRKAGDLNDTIFSLVVFLLAAVDTTFYCWVFLSINNILSGLAARKQAAKYVLYRNFRHVLFLSLFANCCWVLYGSVIRSNTETGDDSNWRDRWTVDALWEVTYFMVFVAIAFLWAPTSNLQIHAYSPLSTDLADLEDDPEYNAGDLELSQGLGPGSAEDNSVKKDADDAEYGGSLNDEDDPYNNPLKGKGALDTLMAVVKKQ